MEQLREEIVAHLAGKIQEMNLFLVDVVIGKNFKIQVFADGVPSITIQQCTRLSRHLESFLDEHDNVPEKYTLEVSSPGMSNPLKVIQQFEKRIGSTLKLTLNDGTQEAMILKEIKNNELIGLKTKIVERNKKRPAKKIKEEDLEPISFKLTEIKQALLHFNF